MRHELPDILSQISTESLGKTTETNLLIEYVQRYPYAVSSRIIEFEETLQNINTLLSDRVKRKGFPKVEKLAQILGTDETLLTLSDMVNLYRNHRETNDYPTLAALVEQSLSDLPELIGKLNPNKIEGNTVSELLVESYRHFFTRGLTSKHKMASAVFTSALYEILMANDYLAAVRSASGWKFQAQYPNEFKAFIQSLRMYRRQQDPWSPLFRNSKKSGILSVKEELVQYIGIKLRSLGQAPPSIQGTEAYFVVNELRMLPKPIALDLDETILSTNRQIVHPQAKTIIDMIASFGTIVFYTNGTNWALTKLELEKKGLWRGDAVLLTSDITDSFSTSPRLNPNPHEGIKSLRDAFTKHLFDTYGTVLSNIEFSRPKRALGTIFGKRIPLIDNDPSNVRENPTVYGIWCESFDPGAKYKPPTGGESLTSAVTQAKRYYNF